MLNNETLWDVAARCSRVLTEGGIAYSVCGGVAVCLHGDRRNTVDLDLVVRREDSARANCWKTQVWRGIRGRKNFARRRGSPCSLSFPAKTPVGARSTSPNLSAMVTSK